MDYKKDYYNILGIDSKATPETLRASYRQLAKRHHPDKNPDDPNAEERFKAINEAYEILSNEITRHIYDSYQANSKKADQPQSQENNFGTTDCNEPLKTTKTRTYRVMREKRIYVFGFIEVKFQGEPELSDVYGQQWEQRFTIFPTEVLATITSSEIYKNGPPKEYQMGYSTAQLFTTPLKQPINCKVITGERGEYYQLELYDIRVKDPTLKDITRHDQHSFGTLQGKLFGYVLHQYEEEVTEEYTEYSGATGQIETKTESGYVFVRQQFYTSDGSTYWAEWKRNPTYDGKHYGRSAELKPIFREKNRWSEWSWLIVLLIVIAIWPKLLLIILPLVAWLLLLAIIGWTASVFNRALPLLAAFAIGFTLLLAIRSLFHTSNAPVRAISNYNFDSVSSKREIVQNRDKQADTVINQRLRWEDRDSSRYAIQFSVSTSTLRRSTLAHQQMDEEQYSFQGIGAVYRFMLDTDDDYTKTIALAFDSLVKARSLDRQKEASMVVSCIQSIPYSLIVDKSCSANYTDDYVRQYLARCDGDCCKGYSKFGVQSPVEFIADLKGDCDTRALLLYDVLRKLGYKVALMTSNYYKHALIAVQLDNAPSVEPQTIRVNGEPYYLWETTSKGFGPGELPPALSNINHWNITLIQ